MIKFDMLHIYKDDIKNISLSGITFVENGKTNNNKESKTSLITYIGETALALSNEKKNNHSIHILPNEDLYMITFLCSNNKKLYEKLKEEKINVTSSVYDTRLNALLIPCKTKFQYMYVKPFEKSNIVFCFKEIDTSTDLLAYQKSMIPNAADSDITGVKEIKIYDNFTQKDYETLSKIFETVYIDGEEFGAEIYDDQTLTLIKENEKKVEITLEVRGKALKGKELKLDNNTKNNITFIY